MNIAPNAETSYRILLEVLACLNENIWTDEIFKLNTRLNEVIMKSPTTGQFVCIICKNHRAAHTGASLKSLVKHLSVGYHLENMRKDQLISLNNELVALFNQDEDDFPLGGGIRPPIPSNPVENASLPSQNLSRERLDDINLKFHLTQFILSKRLPFNIAPDLADFVQNIVTHFNKNTLLNCSLDRTKAVEISRDCISRSLKENIFEELRASPFSLLIDGGSDFYGNSYLSICAKFINKENQKEPVTKLVSIIKLEDDYTGETLYNIVKKTILKDEAISKNLMGVSTDQARNMISEEKGLAGYLHDDFEHVFFFNDLCHIYNLICKDSLKIFPDNIIKIVKAIGSHFNHSNQRKFVLKQMQEQSKPALNVLSYTPVRWLSLTESLERILKLWEVLKEYFLKYGEENEIEFFTSENEFYMKNMFILLEQLMEYNTYFQKTNIRYDEVFYKISESFLVFAQDVLLPEHQGKGLEHCLGLDWRNKDEIEKYLIKDEDFIKNWINMYKGIKEVMPQVEKQTAISILLTVKKFIIEVLCQMKERLPYETPVLKASLEIFFTSEAFNRLSWRFLADSFPNIIYTEEENRLFEGELKRISTHYSRHRKEHIDSGRSILQTWNVLSAQYPLMSKLAQSILVLPHTSSPVERIFAQIEDIMTPKRNRLTTENLEACLIIHQAQEYEGYDFEITEDMLSRYHNLGKSTREEEKTQEIQPILNPSPRSQPATTIVQQAPPSIEHLHIEVSNNNSNTAQIVRQELANYFSSLTIQSPKVEEPKRIKKRIKRGKRGKRVKEERSEEEEEEEEEEEAEKVNDEDASEIDEEVEVSKPKTRTTSGKRKAANIAKPKPNKQVRKLETKGGKKKTEGGT